MLARRIARIVPVFGLKQTGVSFAVGRFASTATAKTSMFSKLKTALATEIKFENESESDEISKHFNSLKGSLTKRGWKYVSSDNNVRLRLEKEVEGMQVSVEWDASSFAHENFDSFDESMDMPEKDAGAKGEVDAAGESSEDYDFPEKMNEGEKWFAIKMVNKSTGAGANINCYTLEDFAIDGAEDSEAAKDEGSQESFRIANIQTFTKEAQLTSNEAYQGPDFDTLDADLQDSLKASLDAIGIDAELVEFLNAAAHNKDTAEYRSWLQQFKSVLP